MGDLPALKLHTMLHPELLRMFSPDGFRLLGLACFFGHEEVARFLVENEADVDTLSNNSFRVTPIHSSCAISNFPITEILPGHGANPQRETTVRLHPFARSCTER